MTQRHTISGRRSALVWLSLLIGLALIVALVVIVLFIYPNYQRQQQLEAHYKACVAFQAAGDWDRAVEECSQAVAIDASYKDVQGRYADARAKQQEVRALANATATAEALSDVEEHYQKCVANIELKRWEEAKNECDKVFAANPNYKDIHAKLASVAAQLALLATQTASATPTRPPEPTSTTVPTARTKVGLVTDFGGIDDRSYNAVSWKGVQDAMNQLGVEGKYVESYQQADYAKNIQQFIEQKYDLIVTVGFLLGVETGKAAVANPDEKFAIVDYAYPDCWPGAAPGKDCGSDKELRNVLGLTFAVDEAAFLAGYLAAGMTKTGKIGTFGGIKIPPITIFLRGFEAGVKYYNQQHGTKVELLGWDTAKDEGLFTGNFESTDDGRRFAGALFDEGGDIVMPVAGPVGLGSAAEAKARGLKIIGVDTDWYISAPEFKEVYLTSILKNMDVAVFDAIKGVVDGTFQGGVYVGTLANGGVGIASFHDYDRQVPQSLKNELEKVKQDLISGKITVDGVLRAR